MDQTGHRARESGDADISRNDPRLTSSVNSFYETIGRVDRSRLVVAHPAARGSLARISRADASSWVIMTGARTETGLMSEPAHFADSAGSGGRLRGARCIVCGSLWRAAPAGTSAVARWRTPH